MLGTPYVLKSAISSDLSDTKGISYAPSLRKMYCVSHHPGLCVSEERRVRRARGASWTHLSIPHPA